MKISQNKNSWYKYFNFTDVSVAFELILFFSLPLQWLDSCHGKKEVKIKILICCSTWFDFVYQTSEEDQGWVNLYFASLLRISYIKCKLIRGPRNLQQHVRVV